MTLEGLNSYFASVFSIRKKMIFKPERVGQTRESNPEISEEIVREHLATSMSSHYQAQIDYFPRDWNNLYLDSDSSHESACSSLSLLPLSCPWNHHHLSTGLFYQSSIQSTWPQPLSIESNPPYNLQNVLSQTQIHGPVPFLPKIPPVPL